MTISSSYSPVSYTANGVQTAFTVTFLFNTSADLDVYVDGVLKTLTTDYTVSGGGSTQSATGTVTFVSAPANAAVVLIKRDVAKTQTSDYVDNAKLPATTLEYNLDRLTMMVQELAYRVTELE